MNFSYFKKLAFNLIHSFFLLEKKTYKNIEIVRFFKTYLFRKI